MIAYQVGKGRLLTDRTGAVRGYGGEYLSPHEPAVSMHPNIGAEAALVQIEDEAQLKHMRELAGAQAAYDAIKDKASLAGLAAKKALVAAERFAEEIFDAEAVADEERKKAREAALAEEADAASVRATKAEAAETVAGD